MRILLVSNMYPSPAFPNYGVFIKNTERILRDSGFDVDTIAMRKDSNRYRKFFRYSGYYISILFKGLFNGYDAVYVHYASHNSIPVLILKSLKKNIRVYTNVHGSDIMPKTALASGLQRYVKLLFYESYRIIVPSAFFRRVVSEKYGVDSAKVYVFPSGGINGDVFRRIVDRDDVYGRLGLDRNIKYIGYVGHINHQKGWDVYIDAIRSLLSSQLITDKRFIIVGSGEQDDMLQRAIDGYGLGRYIIRYGMLPQDALCDIYNCLEVLCFPTRGESLGLVGLEAMSCGIPVIGSRVGALSDYIDDGENGLLFDAGDGGMLKDKLVEYFALSEDRREQMRRCALSTAERYMVENIKRDLVDIFS